ncbi:putative Flp pilus-assembly TadE/G-like [Longilinea arvoryzae]|uniref:Putative Flp pilus-assembly TadE/G-like n=1 Tax=Longilinea arvoryzae TaxID=360412 RepID=A0A0S7BKL9_9CHLR|nr:pilus assembly protein TadG-related protein [Longilinea arvoryzae]GAP15652.1 putative Flp pilus-assembly TadE/G-like [Longilinea arvoryzae]
MKVTANSQRGQIIILFALVAVGLLAFGGLAIDSAMVYSDRRFDQSTADAAALAGAGAAGNVMQTRDIYSFKDFDCSDFDVAGAKMNAVKHEAIDAAINRAAQNSITIDNNLSDQHGVEVYCRDLGEEFYEKYIEVKVQVTTNTQTSFSQLVSSAPLVNTVTSVARVYPPTTTGFGNAIVSLDDTPCASYSGGGIDFQGSIDVTIDGGGVFSSSCISGGGHVNVGVDDPGFTYMDTFDIAGGGVMNPLPATKSQEELPAINIADPADKCGSGPYVSQTGSGTIGPGNYSRIKVGNSESLILQPGLYCMKGDFEISGSANITGHNVTIYLQKYGSNRYSNFSVTGTGTVILEAPPDFEDYTVVANEIQGVLIRSADNNTAGVITLEGGGAGLFEGTIYGPNNLIKVGGTSSTNTIQYNTELIGKKVSVSGNTTINLNYDDYDFSIRESWLTLVR